MRPELGPNFIWAPERRLKSDRLEGPKQRPLEGDQAKTQGIIPAAYSLLSTKSPCVSRPQLVFLRSRKRKISVNLSLRSDSEERSPRSMTNWQVTDKITETGKV